MSLATTLRISAVPGLNIFNIIAMDELNKYNYFYLQGFP